MPPRFAPGALRRFRTLRAALQTLARLRSSAPLRVRTPPPASARGGRNNKKSPHRWELKIQTGGGGGIRTLVTLYRPNGFRDRRIQPLCHPSAWGRKQGAP